MTSYIIRRLFLIIPTVFLALSFLFFLFFALPGDPASLHRRRRGPRRRPRRRRTHQRAVRPRRPDPRPVQGLLGAHDHSGTSASRSSTARASTTSSARSRSTASAWASGPSSSRSSSGISVGMLSAIRRYSLSDRLTTIVTAAASAIPVFVLGFVLQYLFAVVPNKQGWPDWAQPAHVGDRPRHLDVLLHPHRRAVALPDPARGHARLRVDRARRPHDPRLDARGAAGRLHAHGQGQGPERAQRRGQARPAQRHAAGRHPHRHRLRHGHRRRHPHRDHVLVAGPGVRDRQRRRRPRPARAPRVDAGGGPGVRARST